MSALTAFLFNTERMRARHPDCHNGIAITAHCRTAEGLNRPRIAHPSYPGFATSAHTNRHICQAHFRNTSPAPFSWKDTSYEKLCQPDRPGWHDIVISLRKTP
jgi:hypothetical protein